jgi:CheY-specific phosphatase CheX
MDKLAICELLEDMLEAAADGIFNHLGIEAEYVTSPEATTHDFACSIGFTSPTLRGNLTLTAHRTFVAETRPSELRSAEEATEIELADWMGELGNQVLGRFKNKLISSGNVIELGTPAVLSGFQIKRRGGRMPLSVERLAQTQAGTLALHVDAQASEAFAIAELDAGCDVMPEGELALF